MTNLQQPTCFVISPIGERNSEIRQRSNRILRLLIEPAAKSLGLTTVRADKIPKPGIITSQVVDLLLNSRVVIADLSFGNPNVFYELALRHAACKPVVHILESGQHIPFDIAGLRILLIESASEDALKELRPELCEYLRASQEAKERHTSTPLSQAMAPWELQASQHSVSRSRIESLVSTYLGLRIISSFRRPELRCRVCAEIGDWIFELHKDMHDITDRCGMSPSDTFYDLERFRWMVGNGYHNDEDFWK
jgi:hypothetical protein